MRAPQIILLVMSAFWLFVLWIDYTNARAWSALLFPVPWRYHLRVRWWSTPRVKLDLAVIAVHWLIVGVMFLI